MCCVSKKWFSVIGLVVLVVVYAAIAQAHKDKPHQPKASTTPKSAGAHDEHAGAKEASQKQVVVPKETLSEINASYLQSVKPIFKVSCFNCHSSQTEYPWYAKLPGAKQLIESDIRESKEHLDITNDFPFGGHGDGPADDLQAIRDAVVNSDMPPFRYWMMHPSSRLNAEEKKTVTDWIDQSLEKLKNASVTSQSSGQSKHSGH